MDDKTEITIIGIMIGAITGMYGIFVKHIMGHVNEKQIMANEKSIETLFECKQDNKTCEQIVKRIDENHKETTGKLDVILQELRSK